MKRTSFIGFLIFISALCSISASAQRIAFVDTKYILENMPEYQSAQDELDRQSGKWQAEVEDRYEQIKRMRDSYNAESILLTEEMKRSRLAEIEKREGEARQLQKKRFGVGGDLFKKRQELIQPIQDRIYQAVKEVAGTSYLAVFDISGQSNLMFASEKYDKSETVLRKMGIRPDRDGGKSGGSVRDNEVDDDQPDDGGGSQEQGGGDERGNDIRKTK